LNFLSIVRVGRQELEVAGNGCRLESDRLPEARKLRIREPQRVIVRILTIDHEALCDTARHDGLHFRGKIAGVAVGRLCAARPRIGTEDRLSVPGRIDHAPAFKSRIGELLCARAESGKQCGKE
jgi:hypothetical protein